jgi:tetratricopeptide (TPR) repeat protein
MWIACLLVALAASTARAESGKAVAHRAYAEGKRLYDVGDYAKALEQFKLAYLNYEDPSFLFNMAQCHRALGDKQEAIRAYKSYLRNSPDAANAGDVRRIVAELESAVAQERAAAEASSRAANAPPPGTLPPPHETAPAAAPSSPVVTATPAAQVETSAPPPAKAKRKTWWIWPVVGVVVAGAAVGLAVGLTAKSTTESSLNTVHFP